jgi:hypothetical protein
MLKRLLRNRKGTAEVIGSVMFIVILLFFFTNVYLWHDAATRQVNDLYVKKMSAGMDVEFVSGNLVVTAKGSDITLSRLWIVEETSLHRHLYADLGNMQVEAGKSVSITFGSETIPSTLIDHVDATPPLVHYRLTQPIKCTVLNTLGVAVSTHWAP